MRKGHSLSALPPYLSDTNTRSLSSSSISPPCPPFTINKVSGWSWAWRLSRDHLFFLRRARPVGLLHRHHGGLVRAHSCLAALVFFFICIFISNASTMEHASASSTKAGEDGMYDQKQWVILFALFLTWPLHNFFFMCRLTVLLHRTEETVHPSCHTHTELIWRHLQPICRSFTKGTTLCLTSANWMW